jgi:hypothetical protein
MASSRSVSSELGQIGKPTLRWNIPLRLRRESARVEVVHNPQPGLFGEREVGLAARAAGLSPSTMTSPTCMPMPEHYHLILLAQALAALGRYGERLAALHGASALARS